MNSARNTTVDWLADATVTQFGPLRTATRLQRVTHASLFLTLSDRFAALYHPENRFITNLTNSIEMAEEIALDFLLQVGLFAIQSTIGPFDRRFSSNTYRRRRLTFVTASPAKCCGIRRFGIVGHSSRNTRLFTTRRLRYSICH